MIDKVSICIYSFTNIVRIPLTFHDKFLITAITFNVYVHVALAIIYVI